MGELQSCDWRHLITPRLHFHLQEELPTKLGLLKVKRVIHLINRILNTSFCRPCIRKNLALVAVSRSLEQLLLTSNPSSFTKTGHAPNSKIAQARRYIYKLAAVTILVCMELEIAFNKRKWRKMKPQSKAKTTWRWWQLAQKLPRGLSRYTSSRPSTDRNVCHTDPANVQSMIIYRINDCHSEPVFRVLCEQAAAENENVFATGIPQNYEFILSMQSAIVLKASKEPWETSRPILPWLKRHLVHLSWNRGWEESLGHHKWRQGHLLVCQPCYMPCLQYNGLFPSCDKPGENRRQTIPTVKYVPETSKQGCHAHAEMYQRNSSQSQSHICE